MTPESQHRVQDIWGWWTLVLCLERVFGPEDPSVSTPQHVEKVEFS